MEINLNKISSCQMEEAAKAAYPGECCGILLGKTAKNSGKGEIEVLETRGVIKPSPPPDDIEKINNLA
jgi:proteasome lid subunit RPN8/RPN11